jgi:uncharacterized membrane protein
MRRTGSLLMFLAAVGVAGYAIVTYAGRPIGVGVHPEMRRQYEIHRIAILSHIFASSVALLVGPLQFLPTLRIRRPKLHRFLGRVYLLIGVGLGGSAGLYMSFFAYGGWVSTGGFALLALAWMFTGVQAYRSARAGDFAQHRRWMVRNFSLTFGAVTLRIGLGIGFGLRLPFDVFYPVLAWVSWIPNIAFSEWYLRRSSRTSGTQTG